MIEQLCDYFAACLLMPRTWVKNAYAGGTQEIPKLARLFDVSEPAMRVRLTSIGLIDPLPRCATDWTTPVTRRITKAMYQRNANTGMAGLVA